MPAKLKADADRIGAPDDARSALERPDERFFATIVENLPNMIFVKDARELRFVRFNRAGEELLGIPREQMIGKNDHDFFPGEQSDFFLSKDREVLAGGVMVDIAEEPIHTRHRGTRILHTKKIPILDEHGQPLYLLGISEDITEQKQARSEMERLNETLRQQSTVLAEVVEDMQSFSYSVSHDLRAPLRSIDGFCHMLLEEHAHALEASGRDALTRVRAAAQRMGSLIDGLLALSRLSRSELRREKVDLALMARRVAEDLRPQPSPANARLQVPEHLEAVGDPLLVETLMRNLLDNAFKFSAGAEQACVEVGAVSIGGEAAYFVRDNGIGFDPAYADRLFRTFERLDNARDFDGSGIGLATVARIVRRHGGKVWAEGAPERGATVYFTLAG
ncbi:MAG TPA: ATP-binding protein [Candidatus Binatia bacterium]|nr:ATP-binding protein [Candidatus Binatia bacterium]